MPRNETAPPPSVMILLLAMGLLQAASLGLRLVRRGPEDIALLSLLIGASLAATLLAVVVPRALLIPFRACTRPAPAPARFASSHALKFLALGVLLLSTATQQLYWDERGLLLAARGVSEGGLAGLAEQYRVNAWLGPQHPPLVPILYGAAMHLVGDTVLAVRLVDVAFALGSLLVVDSLLTHTIGRRRAVQAILLLLASPLFLRMGSAITNDMPMVFFFLLTLRLGLHLLEKPTNTAALALGAAISLAILAKYTALFVLGPLLAIPTIFGGRRSPDRRVALAAATAGLVLATWGLAAWQMGWVETQLAMLARFAGNAWNSGVFLRSVAEAMIARLPSAIGVYIPPLLLIAAWRAWPPRRETVFLLVWVLAVVVPVALTAPLARYMLPAFPALAALASAGLPAAPDDADRVLLLGLLLVAITLSYYALIDLRVLMFLLG